MAGMIVGPNTYQYIRTQRPLGFVEMSDGSAYLYGLLVIKHSLCPDDKAYLINQDVVNDIIIWNQMMMGGDLDRKKGEVE